MNFFVDQHNFTIYATQSRIHTYIYLYVYSFTSTVYKFYSVRFANFTFLQELRVYSIYTMHVGSLLYPFSQRCSTFYPIFSQRCSFIPSFHKYVLSSHLFTKMFSPIPFFTKMFYIFLSHLFTKILCYPSFAHSNCVALLWNVYHKILYYPIGFFTKILYNAIFSRRFWSNSFSTKNLYCPHVFMKILHNHIFFAIILYNPIFSTKILN